MHKNFLYVRKLNFTRTLFVILQMIKFSGDVSPIDLLEELHERESIAMLFGNSSAHHICGCSNESGITC